MVKKLMSENTHTCMPNSRTPAIAMHKNSQKISKTKPKIRIIHMIAPQIIKTDIENFRELVQRVTGKSSGDEKYCKKKAIITCGIDEESIRGKSNSLSDLSSNKPKLKDLINGGDSRESVKEVGLCSNDESCGGYFGGFSELEGFISDEVGEFPLFPLEVQGFQQSQL